jgi:hypothetical protein
MKEFLLIFRRDYIGEESKMSPEQMQAMMKPWQDWMGSLGAQNKLGGGNRLGLEGNVVRPDKVVTNGPYVETKEAIGGYLIVKADTLAEATEMAKGCPILSTGGSVEVRNVMMGDEND